MPAKPSKIQKLTREEAVALVKVEEPTIDFAAEDSDLLSLSQLGYLSNLYTDRRLRGFRYGSHSSDQNGSIGRAVYNYLARHKEQVFVIYGNYGQGNELLCVETTRKNASVNVRAYNANNPGHGHFFKRKLVTARQLANLK